MKLYLESQPSVNATSTAVNVFTLLGESVTFEVTPKTTSHYESNLPSNTPSHKHNIEPNYYSETLPTTSKTYDNTPWYDSEKRNAILYFNTEQRNLFSLLIKREHTDSERIINILSHIGSSETQSIGKK